MIGDLLEIWIGGGGGITPGGDMRTGGRRIGVGGQEVGAVRRGGIKGSSSSQP